LSKRLASAVREYASSRPVAEILRKVSRSITERFQNSTAGCHTWRFSESRGLALFHSTKLSKDCSHTMQFMSAGATHGACWPFGANGVLIGRSVRLILSGDLPAGIGIDDGVAVLYENRKIKEIVSNKPGPTAYRASRNGRSVVLEALPARHLATKPNPTPHPDARHASRKVQTLGMRAGGRER
jgi:hypothetical protein